MDLYAQLTQQVSASCEEEECNEWLRSILLFIVKWWRMQQCQAQEEREAFSIYSIYRGDFSINSIICKFQALDRKIKKSAFKYSSASKHSSAIKWLMTYCFVIRQN